MKKARVRSVHLKKPFLESFAVTGNITESCEAIGLRRRADVYWWQEHDDAFAEAFRAAEIEATERLEAEARRRAVEGVPHETPIYYQGEQVGSVVETKYSDTLLIFLLKARAPEKYREKFDHRHSGEVRQPVRYIETTVPDAERAR